MRFLHLEPHEEIFFKFDRPQKILIRFLIPAKINTSIITCEPSLYLSLVYELYGYALKEGQAIVLTQIGSMFK